MNDQDGINRDGFYGPTVQAEYDWHELIARDPLAMQRLMIQWGMVTR